MYACLYAVTKMAEWPQTCLCLNLVIPFRLISVMKQLTLIVDYVTFLVEVLQEIIEKLLVNCFS